MMLHTSIILYNLVPITLIKIPCTTQVVEMHCQLPTYIICHTYVQCKSS